MSNIKKPITITDNDPVKPVVKKTKSIRELAKTSEKLPTNDVFDVNSFLKEKDIDPESVGIRSKNFEAREVRNAGDLDRLTDNTWQMQISNNSYNATLAANQSVTEQMRRSGVGFSKQLVAGFVDSVAAWDMTGIYDMAVGNTEAEYGNWLNQSALTKWGKNMDGNQIYQQGDSMMDYAYWAKAGQSFGYTAGIVGEMFAEQAIMNTILPGSGVVGLASKAAKGKKLFQAGFGMFKGVQEGYMNALETQEQVYQKYKQQGYSENESKRRANEAATLNFRLEVGPLMMLNSFQFTKMFGGAKTITSARKGLSLGFSDTVEEMGEKLYSGLTKHIKNEGVRKTTNKVLGNVAMSVSEGVEEGIQAYVQKKAIHTSDKKYNQTFDSFDPYDTEFRDAVVQGAMGGLLMGMGHKVFNKVANNTNKAYTDEYLKRHEQFIKDATFRTAESLTKKETIVSEYNEAVKNYSKKATPENKIILDDKVKLLQDAQYDDNVTNTVTALQLDYLNNSTTAYEAHIEQMQTLLTAVNENDTETLKKYMILDENGKERFKDSLINIKETFGEKIKDAEKIKKSLDNNLLNVTSDFESAFNITRKEYINQKNIENLNKLENDISVLYNTDNNFQLLSEEGKNRFKLQNEWNALNQVENDKSTRKLSQEDKKRQAELRSMLEESPAYTRKDKQILSTITEKSYIDGEVSKISYNHSIENNIKEIGKLKDKEYIKKTVKERYEKRIDTTKDKEDLDLIEKDAKKQGIEKPSFFQKIKNRKKEVTSKEKLDEIKTEGRVISKQEEKAIEEYSKEHDSELTDMATVMEKLHQSGMIDDKLSKEDLMKMAFSRRSNKRNITEQDIEKANNIVKRKDNEYGHEINLQEFIEDYIKTDGYKKAESLYNGLVSIYELTGRDVSNSQEIYDNLFSDITSFAESFLTTENINDNIQTTENKVKQETDVVDSYNGEGKVVINPVKKFNNDDARTDKSKSKIAYNFTTFTREGDKFTTTSKSLQGDNFYILDSESVKPGDELSVAVINDDSVPVTFTHDGKQHKMTLGEFKKSFTNNQEIYNNSVPIGIYKTINNKSVLIGYVQDATWYNPNNINSNYGKETQQRIAREGFENMVNIRNTIINNGGKGTIIIDKRGFGSLDNINKSNDNKPLTLSEATGDNMLAIAKYNANGEIILQSRKGYQLDIALVEGQDLNKKNTKGNNIFYPGSLVDLRYSHTDSNGVRRFIALNTLSKRNTAPGNLKEPLNRKLRNTISYAMLANIVLENNDNNTLLQQIENELGFSLSNAITIQKEIQKNLGIDIKSNVLDYMSLFVRVSGNSLMLDNKDKYSINYFKSNFTVELFKQKFGNNNDMLSQTSFNVNQKFLNSNVLSQTPITMIDNHGQVNNDIKGFNNLVKSFIYTSIRSHEITRENGDKLWVTDIQPMIYYSLKNEIIENTTNTSRVETIIQKQEENNNDESSDTELTAEEKALIGLDEEARLSREDTNISHSRRVMTDVENISMFIRNKENVPTLLADDEYKELLSSFKHSIISDLMSNDNVTGQDVGDKISTVIDDNIKPILKTWKSIYNKLQRSNPDNTMLPHYLTKIQKLQNIVDESHKIIGNNSILRQEIQQLFNIDNSTNNSMDDYVRSSLEKNVKLAYSDKMRLMFFGVPKLARNSDRPVLNLLTNMKVYENADSVELLLRSVTSDTKADWDSLLNKLMDKYRVTGRPIFYQIHNQIKGLSKQLQNELLYKMVSTKLTVHKVLLVEEKHGKGKPSTYVTTVIDENSSKEHIKLKTHIKNNFIYQTNLSMFDENTNEWKLNKDYANAFLNRINKANKNNLFGEVTPESLQELKDIFLEIGISLSDNTLDRYLQGNDPFLKQQGLLHFVRSYLTVNIKNTNDVITTDTKKNIFYSANKALNTLIDLEIMLNGTGVAKSIRVKGKTLQGTIQQSAAFIQLENMLDHDSQTVEDMLNINYTKDNVILQQIKNNPQMREILSLSFSSPDSFKFDGRETTDDTDYDKLSDVDAFISKMGLYTNTHHGEFNGKADVKLGVEYRIAQVPFMSLSDKGRMLYLKTIILDIKDNQLHVLPQGKVTMRNEIMDVMFEQLFESEYNRIIDAYENSDPNVKAYSEFRKIFNFIPGFNTITVNGENIHDILKHCYIEGKPMPTSDIFKTSARKIIMGVVNNEVSDKMKIITENEMIESTGLKYVSSDYFNKYEGDSVVKTQKLMTEYAINNLLTQASNYQLFLGDMAYYGKDRNILNNDGFVNTDYIVSNYNEIGNVLGTVVNKRAASLIAPGNRFANSANDSYIQLEVNDNETVSNTIDYLLSYYNDILSEEDIKNIDILKNPESTQQEIDNSKSSLIKNHEIFKPYFKMEGTDAQEYTTWKTHVDMLFRQGKLSEEQETLLQSAYTKMSNGDFNELSKEELSVVMQPVKPVVSGLIPLRQNGNVISMRPTYIKSSSFPLLPQTTTNLKLDNIRKHLEHLEAKYNKPVRMSYQTANKIGSNKTLLTVNDLYNNSPSELESKFSDNGRNVLESGMITLPFKNIRIQQETPDKISKAVKKHKENRITMGSQFWKNKLGNGVNKITEKVFPNLFSNDLLSELGVEVVDDMISGEDLDKIDFHVFSNFSNTKKRLLMDRLGLSNDTPYHQKSNTEKQQILSNIVDIVKKEIVNRDYPLYLTEILNVITDENGDYNLAIPLFLDSNANKFESLLQSIITNSLVRHELPGLGTIVGSSEGFEKVSDLEAVDNKEGIVWLNGYQSKLNATVVENGELKEAEVLMKSHYKRHFIDENGDKQTELIDLSSDTYSENIIEDGKIVGRRLLLEAMDEELKSMFSFRIPTSSHQSGVIIKVVGFLPPSMGDLLIVPAEHTVQLGEDYDVDKRYLYTSNYSINKNTGKIEKLHYQTDVILEQEQVHQDLYNELKSYVNELRNENKELYDESKLITVEDNDVDALLNGIFGDSFKEITDSLLSKSELHAQIKENKELVNMLYTAYRHEKSKLPYINDKLVSILKDKRKIEMYENAMIDIYKAVYQTTDKRVQRKIFKPLSMDVASNAATMIDEKLNSENRQTNFTPLSDEFQRGLLKAGADGKTGIGVHSNAVTREAQLQRLSNDDKLVLTKTIFDEHGNPIKITRNVVIGDIVSDGKLGVNYQDFFKYRDIAEHHGENQNVSTDNINEQIMIKRNENKYTMNVFALMASRGIDVSIEDNKTFHIPSLFMKQPIVMDYVELLSKYDSVSSDFIANKHDTILNELLKKYNYTPNKDKYSITNFLSKPEYDSQSRMMTGQQLYDNLNSKVANNNPSFQLAVLQKFAIMKAEGDMLSDIQNVTNMNTSRGVGMSYFQVLEHIEKLNQLPDSDVINASKLIGDYAVDPTGDLLMNDEQIKKTIDELLDKGYVKLGDYYWKPLTNEGVMVIDSLSSAEKLMDIFFPYKSAGISRSIDAILDAKYGNDIPNRGNFITEQKYEIMREYRSYLNSYENSKLFKGDVNEERFRLFMDTDTNMSLASIIADIQKKKLPVGNNNFVKNLVPTLSYKVKPSLLSYYSDNETLFDSYSEYDSFFRLLLDNETIIGEYNGEQYTYKMLGQDLASYALLSDNSNAKGFGKLIPVDYLMSIGYDTQLRNINNNFNDNTVKSNNFVKQYFQHNPQRAKILTKNNITLPELYFQKDDPYFKLSREAIDDPTVKFDVIQYLKSVSEFSVLDDFFNPKFHDYLSINVGKDSNGDTMYKLFQVSEITGEGNVYKEVETLNTRGVNQYNINIKETQPNMLGLQYQKTPVKPTMLGTNGYYDKGADSILGMFDITQLLPETKGVKGILEVYANSDSVKKEDKEFIKYLLNYGDITATIKYLPPADDALGMYNRDTNEIYIHPDIFDIELSKNNDISVVRDIVREVLIEEVIHSMTINEFNNHVEYIDNVTGDIKLKDNAPIFATKLVALYNSARELVPFDEKDISTYYSKDIYEFMAGMFVSPDYRKTLEAKEEGLIKRFLSALRDMLGTVYTKVTGDILSFKDESRNAVYDLLKNRKPSIRPEILKQYSTKEYEKMNKMIKKERKKMKSTNYNNYGLQEQQNPVILDTRFKKDQVKANYANKIIAYGSHSTGKYAEAFGGTATEFESTDVVMISVNGRGRANQEENIKLTKKAIKQALKSGVVTFIADTERVATSDHNKSGEGVIRDYLLNKGLLYSEYNGVGIYTSLKNLDKRQPTPKVNPVTETKSIPGDAIQSNSKDEFVRKLTNPGNNIAIEYKGKKYKNAEHVYQTWKSGSFDRVSYDVGNSLNGEDIYPNKFRNIQNRKNISINTHRWNENTPKTNINKAFVFTENINSIGSNRKGGGSAIIRNNPNAIGIVTKKYYVYKEDRATSNITGGWNQNFKNTDSDFELFKKINTEQFDKIDKYNDIEFTQTFASSLAAIPERFAVWLQSELNNRYGLVTQLNENKTGLIATSVNNTQQTKKVNKELSYQIMVDILTEKLKQHPDLYEGIKKKGGYDYLSNSSHMATKTNDFWTGVGEDSGFIRALRQAVVNINTEKAADLFNEC